MESKKTIAYSCLALTLAGVGYYIFLTLQHRSEVARLEAAFNRGDYAQIAEELESRVTPSGADPQLRLLLGKAQYKLGEYDQALETLDPLTRYGLEEAEAVILTGWIWLREGSYLRAKERFDLLETRGLGRGAERDAGYGAVALVRSGRYRQADLDEARSLLQKAISEDPSITEAHLYLTEYFLIQHQYEDAARHAQRAAEIDPHWAEPYIALGRTRLQNGQFGEAQEAIEEAIERGAGEEQANFYLARSLYLQGELNNALGVLLDLTGREAPIARDAREDAAGILALRGDWARAAEMLEEAMREEPRPDAAMQLYNLLTRLGERERAGGVLEDTISRWPLSGEAQFEAGNRHLRNGDADGARRAYMNVLDDDPRNPWANHNLGCVSVMLGEMYHAPEYFEIASRFHEGFFEARVNNALALLALGRVLEGRSILQELMYERGDNPVVLQAQALERFMAGHPEVSLKRIEQTLETAPGRAVPLIVRGEVYLRLFQFADARLAFQEALALEPDSIRALLGLAHASYRLGEFDRAETRYAELDSVKGELPKELRLQVRNGLALSLARDGEYAQAVDIWDAMRNESETGRQFSVINRIAASGQPPSELDLSDLENAMQVKTPIPELLYNYALLASRFGNREAALEAYERVANEYPSFLPALYNLAAEYREANQPERAAALYERALQAAPSNPEIMNNLAAILAETGRSEQAAALLAEAEEKNPGETTVLENRVLIALEAGGAAEAEKRFEALGAAGRSEMKPILRGLIQAGKGNRDEAAASFREAAEAAGPDPYALINYGVSLAKENRMAEAERVLKRCAGQAPELADAHRALGLLYCGMGLYGEALESLTRAKRLNPAIGELDGIIGQLEQWAG